MPAAKKTTIAAKTKLRTPAKAAPAKPAPVKPAPAAKPVAKSAAKPLKPAPKSTEAPAKAPAGAPAAKAVKPEKAKKPKLVRDSFTIPKAEYLVLEDLKQRAAKLAHAVKKSELLRAGIKALAAMPDAGFLAAVQAVPAIKTGRPAVASA